MSDVEFKGGGRTALLVSRRRAILHRPKFTPDLSPRARILEGASGKTEFAGDASGEETPTRRLPDEAGEVKGDACDHTDDLRGIDAR
jgi:hypothetical protein